MHILGTLSIPMPESCKLPMCLLRYLPLIAIKHFCAHAPAVVSLCRKLKEHCMLLHNPRRALPPLLAAVSKLASPELITPLHGEVLQL